MNKIFFFTILGVIALSLFYTQNAYAVTVYPGTNMSNPETSYTTDVHPNFNVTAFNVTATHIFLGNHSFDLNSTTGQVNANITKFYENNNMTLHLTSSLGNVHLFVYGHLQAVKLGTTFYPYGTNWQYVASNTVTDIVVGSDHDVFITFNSTAGDIVVSSFSLTGYVSGHTGIFNYPHITISSPINANLTDMALFNGGFLIPPVKSFNPPISLLANQLTTIPWSFQDTSGSGTKTYLVAAVIQSGSNYTIATSNAITLTYNTSPSLILFKTDCQSLAGNCFSFHRFANFTKLNLLVNETSLPFHINIRMVNATFNQTVIWHNYTSINGLNATYNVPPNDFAYGAGFGSGQLFSFSSPGNGTGLSGGIHYLDTTFGGFLGVPMGVFFLLIVAGLATGKTAPTTMVIMLATAAILGALGFFVINQGVWGLCLIAAALCLFAGRKVF